MIMAFRPHYFSGVYPAGICHSIVPTFCAFAPLLLMLADASASTLDASSPLLLMLAPEGEEKMMDRRSRTDVTDYDRRRSIRRLSQKGCRGVACTSLFLRGGILYVI